jgi:hypothetical protein
LGAFQLAAIADSSLSKITTDALAGLPQLSAGLSLEDWISPPADQSAQSPRSAASALGTELLIYSKAAPGATPDFSSTLFADAGLAKGQYAYDDPNAGPQVTFTGTAGITADDSTLNSYEKTVTVPTGITDPSQALSGSDLPARRRRMGRRRRR